MFILFKSCTQVVISSSFLCLGYRPILVEPSADFIVLNIGLSLKPVYHLHLNCIKWNHRSAHTCNQILVPINVNDRSLKEKY